MKFICTKSGRLFYQIFNFKLLFVNALSKNQSIEWHDSLFIGINKLVIEFMFSPPRLYFKVNEDKLQEEELSYGSIDFPSITFWVYEYDWDKYVKNYID